MGQTYTSLLAHCIFSTKDREPRLVKEIAPEVFAYMGGIVKSFGGAPLLINGVADHVHMLVSLPATVAVAEAMRVVKANSSKWVHETWREHRAFVWQNGYGAFSVSRSNQEAVLAYVAGQEEHHRRVTFQEEFIAFLERHGVEYDPRYVWQ